MCLVFVCVGFVVVVVCLWNRFVFVLFVLVCVFVVFLTRPTRFAVCAAKSGTPDWRASNPSGIESGAFVWTVPSASLPPKKRAWRARRWPYCTKELNVKQRVLFCLILLSLVDYTVPFDFFFFPSLISQAIFAVGFGSLSLSLEREHF